MLHFICHQFKNYPVYWIQQFNRTGWSVKTQTSCNQFKMFIYISLTNQKNLHANCSLF